MTGGAIASPQILMCSGIGPKEHLEEHGIEVISDLPCVGENLQDHPAAVVSYKTPKKGVSVTSKLRLFGKTNPVPVLKWFLFKTGLLTSTGCDHGGFMRTAIATDQPDLQMRFIAAKALGPDGMTTFTQFKNTKKVVCYEFVRVPFYLYCASCSDSFSCCVGGRLHLPEYRCPGQEPGQDSPGVIEFSHKACN